MSHVAAGCLRVGRGWFTFLVGNEEGDPSIFLRVSRRCLICVKILFVMCSVHLLGGALAC